MAAYNVQSLFIFFAIISLLGGGVASLCFKRLDTSAKYWTVATVLWGITGMLTVFRNELPPLWSYSIPIGVNSASFILMGLGIVRLYKQGPQWPSLLALSLATVVYTVTMELCRLHAGPKVTLVLSGLAFGLSSIWCAYPAHVHFKLTRNRFSMHMRWVMAGLGVLLQGAAGDVLHDDVAEFFRHHRIENLDDVRVVELADQRGFVQKEMGVDLALISIIKNIGGGNLDRHVALGEGVAAQVDRAAGPFADLFDQLIFAEFFEHRLGSAYRR